MDKQNAMKKLKKHLAELFDSRFLGVNGATYAQHQGFTDGYMQAIHDLAIVDDKELLKLVADERHTAAQRDDIGRASIPPGPALAGLA